MAGTLDRAAGWVGVDHGGMVPETPYLRPIA
jgi:hypothetical protein